MLELAEDMLSKYSAKAASKAIPEAIFAALFIVCELKVHNPQCFKCQCRIPGLAIGSIVGGWSLPTKLDQRIRSMGALPPFCKIPVAKFQAIKLSSRSGSRR